MNGNPFESPRSSDEETAPSRTVFFPVLAWSHIAAICFLAANVMTGVKHDPIHGRPILQSALTVSIYSAWVHPVLAMWLFFRQKQNRITLLFVESVLIFIHWTIIAVAFPSW